jgi:hypothetical protein
MDIAPTALRPHRHASRLPILAAIWSALTLTLGLWWWLLPGHYPFVPDPDDSSGTVLGVVPMAAVSPALIGAGLVGLGVAALARTGRGPCVVVGTALAWVLVFGLAVPGFQPLTRVGYLMALFGPIVLFATVLAGAWSWRGGAVLGYALRRAGSIQA